MIIFIKTHIETYKRVDHIYDSNSISLLPSK